MSNIKKYIPFVKDQIDHYDRMSVKFRSNPEKLKIYGAVVEKLRSLLSDLENIESVQALNPAISSAATHGSADNTLASRLPPNFLSNPLFLSPVDYAGIDEDLLSELNISESDKIEALIVELIDAAGGTLILDKIILGLFHLTGEKHLRTPLTARLYRMNRKNIVFSVPKKKGLYTTTKPESIETEEEDGNDLV